VIVVDPDIDVHSSDQVEWATAFRMQPERDVIIVDSVPAGPLDPSVDDSIALDARTGSAIGIDATYPFGRRDQKRDRGTRCRSSVWSRGRRARPRVF